MVHRGNNKSVLVGERKIASIQTFINNFKKERAETVLSVNLGLIQWQYSQERKVKRVVIFKWKKKLIKSKGSLPISELD